MGQRDTELTPMEYNTEVDDIQASEYPKLQGTTYMDHGGTTIYAKSLIEDFAAEMIGSLYGNPHSACAPAKLSSQVVDETRKRALQFFGADPEHFDLVFVANATAAIKLVMDCFKDLGIADGGSKASEGGFWYGYHVDSHNSIIGVRECSGNAHLFRADAEVDAWLSSPSLLNSSGKIGLFAYPGQSNMTGRRLPLSWPARLRNSSNPVHRDTYTLFDAAALATTSPLNSVFSDPARAPDFTSLSFYKIFGFPDLGGLIIRKASGRILAEGRRYFGGGTVELVTVHGAKPWHERRGTSVLHRALEDGTLPFHSIIALNAAINTHERLYGPDPMTRISRHANFLAKRLYDGLTGLRHPNGQEAIEVYNGVTGSSVYGNATTQGATVSFNVRDADGMWVPYTSGVERAADKRRIYVRSGQLCNPGGVSVYLGLERWHYQRLWAYGHRCGQGERSGTEIYYGKPTGMVRVSMGAMTTKANVDDFLAFLREEYILGVPQPMERRMTLEDSISRVIRLKYDDESLDERLEDSDTKSEIDIAEADHSVETPELLEINRVPEVQRLQEVQRFTEVQRLPEVQRFPEVQRLPEVQRFPEIQRFPEVQRFPEAQRLPELQRFPEVQRLPEVQRFSEVQRLPEAQRLPEVQRLPEIQQATEIQESSADLKNSDIVPGSFTSSVTHVNSSSPPPEEKEQRAHFRALPSPTTMEKEELAIRPMPRPLRADEKRGSTVFITSVQGLEMMKSQIIIRSASRAADLQKKEQVNGLKKFLSTKVRPRRSADPIGMF